MTERDIATSGDVNAPGGFWQLYLREHQQRSNRWMHAVGTLLACVTVVATIVTRNWWLLLVALVVGYGLAWIGHLTVEKNRPLSMRYPLRSLVSDFRLAGLMLMGRDPGLRQDSHLNSRERT
jgi:hypothetical protein